MTIKDKAPPTATKELIVDNEKINKFVEGSEDGNTEKVLDPKAPRKFKSITVYFNEYEHNELVIAAKLSNRGVLNTLRHAMLIHSKQLQKNTKLTPK